MVKELGDKAAQGRTYGNLGNTYYLLGEFETAVNAHEKVGSRPLKKILSVSASGQLLHFCIFIGKKETNFADIGCIQKYLH